MLRILFVLVLFISVGCADKDPVSPDTSPKVSTATSTTSIGDWSSTVDKVEEAVYAMVLAMSERQLHLFRFYWHGIQR